MDSYILLYKPSGFLGDPLVKNLPANAGDTRHGLDPWVGEIPWRRKWQSRTLLRTQVYKPLAAPSFHFAKQN